MYGLVQSDALWFKDLSLYLHELCFEHVKYDSCVLKLPIERGKIAIVLYVDDLLVMFDHDEDIEWLAEKLENEYGSIVINIIMIKNMG
mmetsp:Transcript_38547/g.38969  ORF Transcript_38547/g.38969 Transcript_38547/m.38969 type:complete len:88 (-) Transcript_38547:4-267(-)